MHNPVSPKHDPLGHFLPRRWPDRLLALVVTMVFFTFGAVLTIDGWGLHVAYWGDRIAKHAMFDGGIAIVLFCLLEITWLIFKPPWVEQFLRRHIRKALLAMSLVLPVIGAYLLYYVFIA